MQEEVGILMEPKVTVAPSTDGGSVPAVVRPPEPCGETVVWSHCAINCQGRCPLRFRLRGGRVVGVDSYAVSTEVPEPRSCLLGQSMGAWMDSPDRLRFPLKRVGPRGEGTYQRIGWDEALDIVCDKLRETIEAYGNDAVYLSYATGVSASTARPFDRLLNCLGGSLGHYNSYSAAQVDCITEYVYGEAGMSGSTLSVASDADLVVLFGSSFAETQQGGGSSHRDWLEMVEQGGPRTILIDCRLSDSAAGNACEWLPINPGTDAALVAGVAHCLITEGLADLSFLHSHCVGFDEGTMPHEFQGRNLSYRAYVEGLGYDYVEKTPRWASRITGVPAERIVSLAHEIASAKSLFVMQGLGSQRRSNGEWTAWAIAALPCLVGQVGLPGTNNGLKDRHVRLFKEKLPAGSNPVPVKIPSFLFTDAIDQGPAMTARNAGVRGADRLKNGIKYLINYAGNCLTNQHSDINRAHRILADESKCEFILGIDTVMCDSLKYADIILPDLFRCEQHTQISSGSEWAYVVSGSPVPGDRYECKSAYEMATLMARKLGIEQEFTRGRSEMEWMRAIYEEAREDYPQLPDFDASFDRGVTPIHVGKRVALEEFRSDPVAHPLQTPSGRIELFSARLLSDTEGWSFAPGDTIEGMDVLPAVPAYLPEWSGFETKEASLPLQLTGFHYAGRIHSSWGSDPLVRAIHPQVAWLNPVDAHERGIEDGCRVHVLNEQGSIELAAKVTPRVIPGVVAVPQGAWHDADMKGDRVDRGGCINTLTTSRPSPLSKGNPQHTNVCQVERASDVPQGDGASKSGMGDLVEPCVVRLGFDASRCSGCKTCMASCARWHGGQFFSSVAEQVQGKTMRTGEGVLESDCSLAYGFHCRVHCREAFCVDACPNRALRRL